MKKKSREELKSTMVILVVIPSASTDMEGESLKHDTIYVVNDYKTPANIKISSGSATKSLGPFHTNVKADICHWTITNLSRGLKIAPDHGTGDNPVIAFSLEKNIDKGSFIYAIKPVKAGWISKTNQFKYTVTVGLPGKSRDSYQGISQKCPADSIVARINKQHNATITEFRNLLHYIATTNDNVLKMRYMKEADREGHKIPNARFEGIPDNDLSNFLNSNFSKNVKVSPVKNSCNMIVGVRISDPQ